MVINNLETGMSAIPGPGSAELFVVRATGGAQPSP